MDTAAAAFYRAASGGHRSGFHQTSDRLMSQFVEPNTYELSDFHGNVHVAYYVHNTTLPGTGRGHRVTYLDKTTSKEFLGDAVHIATTHIGRVVTVTIRQTLDSGSTSFTFLLPRVNLLLEGSNRAPIETEGITTTHRQSPVQALNRGQRDVYSVMPLVGTASRAIVSTPPPERLATTPSPEIPRTPLPPSMFPRRK